jgi:tetratricopeptide (TPR) repeat protein
MKKSIAIIGLILLIIACKTDPKQDSITHPEDYNVYLNTSDRPTYELALSTKEFWSKRLRTDSSGVGDLGPLAGSYEQLFVTTGNTTFLRNAEQLYLKGIQISANNKDQFARGLAHNYISQHRFQEAFDLLQKTLEGPAKKHETNLMLFDAAMEVGAYEKAYEYLNEVKNLNDYNYLIRLAKWSDHRGDLDSAIRYMELAMAIAESRDSKPLKIWTYSNLADYYGHAGRISDSYEHYLKTLALQPDNMYVKKGIAWMVYSEEKNSREAHRIMDSVMKGHKLPDYHLFKAELYEFEGYKAKAENAENDFISAVEIGAYGDMYNAYLISLYCKKEPKRALEIAQREIENRATPETYHLLALAQLQNGRNKEALQTIETYVEGKTSEPKALFHSALVYKANDRTEKVESIKAELKKAYYELGPVIAKRIEAL